MNHRRCESLRIASHGWHGLELLFLARSESWLDERRVLLPETASATESMGRSPRAASNCRVIPIGKSGRQTISAGVAEHVDAEGGNAWFRRADAMLYGAKREGRNCVRADTRGNSDAWAEAQGPASLHLVWQEGFESGMPAIDSEHRELFDQANALLDATLLADAPDGAAAKAFDGLIDRIAAHFRHEEELLDLHGFKALDAHRRAHAGLLARARELRQSWAAGITGPGALVEFLAGDVVARHLLKADREFFPLFAREGTSAKG